MYQLNFTWQELIDSIAYDRMRLSTADLHDHPWLGCNFMDIFDNTAHQIGIAIFSNILHDAVWFGLDCPEIGSFNPSSSSRLTISLRVSREAIASSSLSKLIANPTWMTV